MRNKTQAKPCCRGRAPLQNLLLLPMGKSRVSGTLKIAVAQTLDLFAIATQEPCRPKVGGSSIFPIVERLNALVPGIAVAVTEMGLDRSRNK
jgi:hypothetical protein